ncbi:nucleotide exchange factor GrpE [Natrialbaceae archaeon A-CW3]
MEPRTQSADALRTTLEIDLEDAYTGVTKQVDFERPTPCSRCDGAGYPPNGTGRRCPDCRGRGRVARRTRGRFGQNGTTCRRCDGAGVIVADRCPTCRGAGAVLEEATIAVEVPSGIETGHVLRAEGEGTPARGGDSPGDLLLEVTVASHDRFERDGDDLRCDLSVPQMRAAEGGSIEVPTLDGGVRFDLPAHTKDGDRFRFEGKGMPRLETDAYGDLYVTIVLEGADESGAASVQLERTNAGLDGEASPSSSTQSASAEPDASTTSSSSEAEASATTADLEAHIEERTTHIEELEADLDERERTIEEYEARLEASDQRIADLEAALEQSEADMQAYKRRTKARQQDRDRRTTGAVLSSFLDVRDDLVRALEQDAGDGLREGVELTLQRFDRALEAVDVTRLEPEPGSSVDPHRHEVVQRVESELPEGTIVDVFTPGFELEEHVIRPARVSVSAGGE